MLRRRNEPLHPANVAQCRRSSDSEEADMPRAQAVHDDTADGQQTLLPAIGRRIWRPMRRMAAFLLWLPLNTSTVDCTHLVRSCSGSGNCFVLLRPLTRATGADFRNAEVMCQHRRE